MLGKTNRKNFFMVSNHIFALGLKPRDLAVYCCLVRHADNQSLTCFPSRKTIAMECNIDRKTVDAALVALTAIGLVKKVHRYRGDRSKTSNLYVLSNLIEYADKA